MENLQGSLSAAVPVDRLHAFCVQALVRSGFKVEDASTTADVLVTTDTWGIFTHGTNNLRDYVRKAIAGGIDPEAQVEVVAEGPAGALVDGHAAMGMVTASKAWSWQSGRPRWQELAMSVSKGEPTSGRPAITPPWH
jgi:LDH2 family malate/lactate/ureidoglycolate dehydrogenase